MNNQQNTINLLTGQPVTTSSTKVGQYSKPDNVKLSEELLHDYASTGQFWKDQAVEDNDFRNGAQWSESQKRQMKKMRMFPIVVNVIHPAVERAKAMMTSNAPRFMATAREDSDAKMAKVFSDLLLWVWDQSQGNAELKLAIDDYYVKGMGLLMAYVDENKDYGRGEVCLKAIDPLKFYPDPNAKDIYLRDATHLILADIYTQEQIQSMYPHILPLLDYSSEQQQQTFTTFSTRSGDKGETEVFNSSSHKKYEMIDRYTKLKVLYHNLVNKSSKEEFVLLDEDYKKVLGEMAIIVSTPTQNASPIAVTKAEHLSELIAEIKQYGNIVHVENDPMTQVPVKVSGPEGDSPNDLPGSTVVYTVTTVEDAIKQGLIEHKSNYENRIQRTMSIGGVLIGEWMLPISEYPIVPMMNRFNRNPYPISDVRMVRTLQEYINKLRSLIIAHAANSANVKVGVPNGSVNIKELEEVFGKVGFAGFVYDAEYGQPMQFPPVPLPNELYHNEATARKDIEEILGVYTTSQGDMSDAPRTFRATLMMDEAGQRRIKAKLDDIEGALSQLGRVCIQMIQLVYTEYKIIRIVQPNNIPRESKLNAPLYTDYGEEIGKLNDVTVGQYDIQIVGGSTLPSNRWARFEYYKELYAIGVIDQVELLKQTEVADTEGVLERFGMMQKMQAQIDALTQQVKDLTGDLQTANREAVHAKKQVEVVKFKSKLDEQATKAKAATQLYQDRLKDEYKDKVESMEEPEMSAEAEGAPMGEGVFY